MRIDLVIISRVPLRITLGGGGTDLPSYYRQFGGVVVAAAINRFIYVIIHRRFDDKYHIVYRSVETRNSIDEIEHTRVRECLRMIGIDPGVEIFSLADIPSESGLGASGAFTVAVLNGLYTHKRLVRLPVELAEEACDIEMEVLKEPVGKQDPYATALGGVSALRINTDGTVHSRPVQMNAATRVTLEDNLLLFYTNIQRSASRILTPQADQIAKGERKTIEAMHKIRELGEIALTGLEAGDPDAFGSTLHEHWMVKKSVHDAMSTPFIDEAYEEARRSGAIGGKIVGAGGGGFLMVYCSGRKDLLINRMEAMGLTLFPFRIEESGVVVEAQL